MPSSKTKVHGMSVWLKTAQNESEIAATSAACEESKAKSKKGKPKKQQRPKTMAELADKYQLYQQAVQHPRKEVRNLDSIFRQLSSRYQGHLSRGDGGANSPKKRGHDVPENVDDEDDSTTHEYFGGRRQAQSLREDFCGTAVLCAEWVSSSLYANRYAYGVDIDPEVIDYAKKHTVGQEASNSSATEDR
ncbi:hypothetical protein EV175_002107, partial [Coemansia sp. RSA 1933]